MVEVGQPSTFLGHAAHCVINIGDSYRMETAISLWPHLIHTFCHSTLFKPTIQVLYADIGMQTDKKPEVRQSPFTFLEMLVKRHKDVVVALRIFRKVLVNTTHFQFICFFRSP